MNRRLERWLLCYAALLPFQIEVLPDLRLAPSDFILLGCLLSCAPAFRYIPRAWSLWHWGILFTLSAGTFVSAAAQGSLSRYVVVNKFVGLLALFLAYVAFTSAAWDWSRIRRFLRVFVAGVFVQNLLAMAELLTFQLYGVGLPIWNPGHLRLSGMLVDANGYGGLLVLALVLNEVMYCRAVPFRPNVWSTLTSLTLACGVVLTFSRTAWVALGAACLLALWLARRMIRRLLVAAAGGAVILSLSGAPLQSYLAALVFRPRQGPSRIEILQTSWDYFARRPLLGLGTGQFFDREGIIVHNTALWFLTEFGLVGLAILLGFLSWFFWKAAQAYPLAPVRERPVLLALVVGHAAMIGLSLGIEAFYQRHWWMVLALTAAAVSVCRCVPSPQPEAFRRFCETRNKWALPVKVV